MRALCHQHTYLYLASPTSLFHMSIWVILYVSWCSAICSWSKVDSLLLSTAVTIFYTRTATFDTGAKAEFAGIERGSIMHLTASIVTSNCVFSSNWSGHPSREIEAHPHNSCLQDLAVRCAVLFSLRPLRACRVFPVLSWLYSTKMCGWIWVPSAAISVASGTLDKGGPLPLQPHHVIVYPSYDTSTLLPATVICYGRYLARVIIASRMPLDTV